MNRLSFWIVTAAPLTLPAGIYYESDSGGIEYALSPTVHLPLKVGYDLSLNQVEGYGDFSGLGQDLVISAGLGPTL